MPVFEKYKRRNESVIFVTEDEVDEEEELGFLGS